jgi:sugar lactone lactonase YvrE
MHRMNQHSSACASYRSPPTSVGLVAVVALAACGDADPCAERVPGTLCTLAGTGDAAFNGDGMRARDTALYLPSQVRRGPDGLLYVMDFNNHRIRKIDDRGLVSTIAGDGFHAAASDGVAAIDSSLENPIDFDFLPDGRLVFVAYHDPRVFVIEHDQTLRVIAGSSLVAERGDEGDGLPPTFARFMELAGIAVAPDGAIYLADSTANRVRVIANGTIQTFAGAGGGPAYSGDGGPATDARLDSPTALAVDTAGSVFVTDRGNCVVRRIDNTGMISTITGTGTRGFSGDGGPAALAALSHPDGIAVAGDGSLYIADRVNSRIRRIGTDGSIETIAGTGVRGTDGDGGPAAMAQLGYVSRIQIDADGGLLIADQSNHVVRKILPPLP